MAAGRDEYFRSFLEGLRSQTVQPGPKRRHRNRGRGKPCLGEERPLVGRRSKKQPAVGWSSADGKAQSCFSRLPPEILLKILSYLDSQSLLCVSHVSKLFHRLVNDDFLWQNIYMSEFGSEMWKLKSADDADEEGQDRSTSCWRVMFFKTKARQELSKWRRELKNISPYTGLPGQTEWVLRNLNVGWELTLCGHLGPVSTLDQSQASYFESSVIVSWSGGFYKFNNISSIQVYGVRKEPLNRPRTRTPRWRSLILKLDINPRLCRFFGKDRYIRVFLLQPSVIVGVWRGDGRVAFVMVGLHFHRLVEKSLLGSPACLYPEPVDPPPAGDSDPTLGLHDYTLHFVLHNTGTEIMSGHFRHLSCHAAQIKHGLVALKVINTSDLSQHRSLSGSVRLPWRRGELEGEVENCCFMTLTLLDEFGKPFWCVSSPVHISVKQKVESSSYSGDSFTMKYWDADGEVRMQLVWLEEQKQFFLVSLTVSISVVKVNKRFGRQY